MLSYDIHQHLCECVPVSPLLSSKTVGVGWGGGHRWPDMALASPSEALTWQRRAAGARIAAADRQEICGQSRRWRREPLARRLGKLSAPTAARLSRDFRAPFNVSLPPVATTDTSPSFPSTMRATRILNRPRFGFKRQQTAAEGKYSCETPLLARSPVLFGVCEALI